MVQLYSNPYIESTTILSDIIYNYIYMYIHVYNYVNQKLSVLHSYIIISLIIHPIDMHGQSYSLRRESRAGPGTRLQLFALYINYVIKITCTETKA